MRINKEAVKNILVVRNDRFGEFLLNIPAFGALKEAFAGARIIAVVDPYVRELAEAVPFIDEVIPWRRGRHSFFARLKLLGRLKRKNIDIAVMLNPSKEFNILAYLAGIPVRAGYDRKFGFLLTHRKEDKKYLGERHEVEYNLELARLVGAETDNPRLFLRVDGARADLGDSAFTGALVALHPWTSDPVKQWPAENFYFLAQRLLECPGVKLAVIGGQEELEKSEGLFGRLGGKLLNLTGKTNLIQLAAFLKRCRLLISGDSGPVHLAASVGVPVLAIFRSDLPAKSAKRWGPWGEAHAVIEKERLCDISVDEVLVKAKEML